MKIKLLFCTCAAALLLYAPVSMGGEPVVFADFEDGSWEGWTVEGTAFGDRPAIGSEDPRIEFPRSRMLEGWSGEAFASSWHANRGDGATGRLISPEFKIEKPVIAFLIAGGRHEDLQCINLVVDDQVVRTATGENSDIMVESGWDVADLKGKTARIEIVDEPVEGNSWAHIQIDRIEFRDK
jgi:hypothetical protein